MPPLAMTRGTACVSTRSSVRWPSRSTPRRRIGDDRGAEAGAARGGRRTFRHRCRRASPGSTFRSPVGLAAGFDKDAEVPEQMLGARLRLRRSRDAHAAAAGGQSEAAPVPARGRPGGDQPHGLQQRGPARRVRTAASRAHVHGIIGVNIGANKDSADRIADYVSGRARDGAGRAITSRSTSARPTRRGCADCRTRARSRSCSPRSTRRAVEQADLPQGRAGPRRGRPGADRPGRHRPQDRRDHRRQHDRLAAAAEVALCERGGRPVGRAAEGAGARCAAPVPAGERRRNSADRRRRDR